MTTPTGAPYPTQIKPTAPVTPPATSALATKADVDTVLDLIQTLAAKVAHHHDRLASHASHLAHYDERLNSLEQRPAALNPALKVDALQQVRNDIEAWLKTLPSGMWVSTGMVARNLGAESEKDVSLYRRQVERMAKLGTLDKEGGTFSGSTAQFRLKRELHPDYTFGDEKFVD